MSWDSWYFENLDYLVYQYLENKDRYERVREVVDPSDSLGFPFEIEETTPAQLEALSYALLNTKDLTNNFEDWVANVYEEEGPCPFEAHKRAVEND